MTSVGVWVWIQLISFQFRSLHPRKQQKAIPVLGPSMQETWAEFLRADLDHPCRRPEWSSCCSKHLSNEPVDGYLSLPPMTLSCKWNKHCTGEEGVQVSSNSEAERRRSGALTTPAPSGCFSVLYQNRAAEIPQGEQPCLVIQGLHLSSSPHQCLWECSQR